MDAQAPPAHSNWTFNTRVDNTGVFPDEMCQGPEHFYTQASVRALAEFTTENKASLNTGHDHQRIYRAGCALGVLGWSRLAKAWAPAVCPSNAQACAVRRKGGGSHSELISTTSISQQCRTGHLLRRLEEVSPAQYCQFLVIY